MLKFLPLFVAEKKAEKIVLDNQLKLKRDVGDVFVDEMQNESIGFMQINSWDCSKHWDGLICTPLRATPAPETIPNKQGCQIAKLKDRSCVNFQKQNLQKSEMKFGVCRTFKTLF